MGIFSYFIRRYSQIKRYNKVIRVLMRYGFEDIVTYLNDKKRFVFLLKLIPKSVYVKAQMLNKWERIRLVCEELGPTFIKFGQILSNRPDLLPPGLILELEKLQDRVPPLDGSIALEILENELGKKTGEVFAHLEHEAFASASMAQVHRGILKTGEKVVVKIQRPGIKETVESDIQVLYYLANAFTKRFPSVQSFDPIGLVKNFEDSILKEMDFILESVSIQRFNHNFTSDQSEECFVCSPNTFPHLTTSKVLTMEFIDGIKISNLELLIEKGYDLELLASRLANSFFKQIFKYGFFHADPHPGNLLVLPGNIICYIDYGMMGNITKKDLQALGSLLISINSKEVKEIIRALQKLTDNTIIRDYRALESDIYEFVQSYGFRETHQNEISTILLELRDLVINHGLKVPAHFFLLVRAMATIEGVIHLLDPKLDLVKTMKPYLKKLLAKKYNPIKFIGRVFNAAYELGLYMEDFPLDLKNVMRKINSGEIKADLRHKGIDPLVHTFNRVGKQIISALLIAALFVGSSQLIIYKIEPLWGDKSVWGVIGIGIAILIAYSLIKDIRKGDHDDWSGWTESR